MYRDFNSWIILLKVSRFALLIFGVDKTLNLIDDLNVKKGLSDKYVIVLFNLVLNWCERSFKRCMKLFMDLQ